MTQQWTESNIAQKSPGELPVAATKGKSFAALFLVYSIGFVLSPYWFSSDATAGNRHPAGAGLRKIGLLALSIGVGLFWAWVACRPSRPRPGEMLRQRRRWRLDAGDLAAVIGIVAFLFWLNWRAMNVGVPWRGDEDFHITRTARLVMNLVGHANPFFLVVIILLAALYLASARLRPRLSWPYLTSSIVLAFLEAAWIWGARPVYMVSLARYPYINRWLSALPVIIARPLVNDVPPFISRHSAPEVMYRLIPLLSAIVLAWVCYWHVRHAQKSTPIDDDTTSAIDWLKWLCGVALAAAVGCVPLVVYYSSTLYIEMPAVVLMTIAAFSAPLLLSAEARDLGQSRAWYALVLIGFVKETTIPFLAAFLICRLIVRGLLLMKRQRQSHLRMAGDKSKIFTEWLLEAAREAGVAAAVLLPLGMYLFFRSIEPHKRNFVPQISFLLSADSWRVLGTSYVQQFGWGLCAMAVAGLILMLARRRFTWAMFLVAAFVADLLLHILDDPRFVGYSRFNLFLLPSLIVAGAQIFLAIPQRLKSTAAAAERPHLMDVAARVAGVCVLAVVVVTNLGASPLHRDGTKIMLWGNYRFDTSEHYYPYREVFHWLDRHKPAGARVLIADCIYEYPSWLYLGRSFHVVAPDPALKPQWVSTANGLPNDALNRIGAALAYAAGKEANADAVIYHLYGKPSEKQIESLPDLHGYDRPLIFRTHDHMLLLFLRAKSTPAASRAPM